MAKYKFKNTSKQRSYNMSRIRSKNTKPEMVLRKALWDAGIKGYRLHRKDIPGTPDIAFIGKKVAIFIDGSFWHGHNWDERKQKLKTNKDYWIPKIERNMLKDEATYFALEYKGWTVLRFWDFEVLKETETVLKRIIKAL